MNRKGLLLAGGAGTRLYPATLAMSKQLLPIYDKPMVYYPLSVLMLAGIRDILVITTPQDMPRFRQLLGDGQQWGLQLRYAIQPQPEGLAQALLIGREFLAGNPCCLILGDNLFWGHDLPPLLRKADQTEHGATIFAYHVHDPSQYGVVAFDASGRPVDITEKPVNPRSPYAVTGLYFYDEHACELAGQLRPSARGELEITDLNRLYLAQGQLHVQRLGRGMAWLDAGTHEGLLDAASFIASLEKRQGLKVACLEEIAWRAGWISTDDLLRQAHAQRQSSYGQYLHRLLEQGDA